MAGLHLLDGLFSELGHVPAIRSCLHTLSTRSGQTHDPNLRISANVTGNFWSVTGFESALGCARLMYERVGIDGVCISEWEAGAALTAVPVCRFVLLVSINSGGACGACGQPRACSPGWRRQRPGENGTLCLLQPARCPLRCGGRTGRGGAELVGEPVNHAEVSRLFALRAMFLLYAAIGLLVWGLYRRPPTAMAVAEPRTSVPLGPSRRVVVRLAALFSVDAFAGGLVINSLLSLWLL